MALAQRADERKQAAEALRHIREAQKLAPLASSELLFLAKQLLHLGELSSALETLREVQATASDAVLLQSHWMTFEIHRERGDWMAAEASLRETLKINPGAVAALRAMVGMASNRHDHAAVIDRAEQALKAIPDDPQILARLHNARLLSGTGPRLTGRAPRTLMVTSVMPGASNTGGRYIQSFIDLLPPGDLAFFCVAAPPSHPSPDPTGPPIAFAPNPMPDSKTVANSEEHLAGRAAAWEAVCTVHCWNIATDIVRFAQDLGVNRILFLMQPLMFRIVCEIRALSSIAISLIVADPPDYQLDSHRVPADLHARFMDDFAQAQRIADRSATVSEAMAADYEAAFGHQPIILRHALDDTAQSTGRRAPRRADALTIALLGNTYAADAISAFIGTLAAAEWSIGGRRITLVCMTPALPPGADSSMPIEHLGWLDQSDVLRVLERCDLGYVPYWFGEQYRSAVRLSFPSKLSTLAAAGIPAFYHGPEDASVTRFLKRHPMGFSCSSLDAADILARLRDFVADPDRFASASAAAEIAFRQEMSHTVFRARLLRLVEDAG